MGLLLGVMVGCQFPRDPDGTLERVRDGTLRAGAVVREPWAWQEGADARPTGVEVALVEELAGKLGARVVWTVDNEGALMEAVAGGALDVVVGGVSAKTPWSTRVGLSQPYLTSRLQVGVPPGQPVPMTLEGLSVAVELGSVAGESLMSEHARVRDVERLEETPGPRATWDWRLEGWGYQLAGEPLHEEKTVWAVPPGENAWLLTVDRFLQERAAGVRQRMVEAVRP